MANKLITMRLGNKLLKEIDSTLENSSFENRTEFIKHAVRALLKEINENSVEDSEREAIRKESNEKTGKFVEEAMEEIRYVR